MRSDDCELDGCESDECELDDCESDECDNYLNTGRGTMKTDGYI